MRSEDDATYSLPEGEERFQMRLRKRYGNVLPLAPVSLDELGTFSGEFVLPDGAPTGTYYVSLLYDGKSVAYTSFTVAEFRAPEFEVGIEPASADFVDGDRIPVEATARFFFGGPVADAAVRTGRRGRLPRNSVSKGTRPTPSPTATTTASPSIGIPFAAGVMPRPRAPASRSSTCPLLLTRARARRSSPSARR